MCHPLRFVNRALISLIGVYFADLTKPQPDEHLLFSLKDPSGTERIRSLNELLNSENARLLQGLNPIIKNSRCKNAAARQQSFKQVSNVT